MAGDNQIHLREKKLKIDNKILPLRMNLMDMNGKVILNINTNETNIVLPSDLSGIYIIRADFEEISFVKKIFIY